MVHGSSESASRIEVLASPEEVTSVLEAALSTDERTALLISKGSPQNVRLDPTTTSTVITFAANTLAGGIAYDLAKTVVLALVRKFGSERVR